VPRKPRRKTVSNLIIVSDIHAGCRMGLCPAEGITLDDGGTYFPSAFQQYMYKCWEEFWTGWVPRVTKGEPWALVVNGDALDGVHHGATTQVSHNLEDQARIALALLQPVVGRAAEYYHIRGTEAHVGKSAAEEERLARELGAIPDSEGRHARWELHYEMQGEDGAPRRIHVTHHTGTPSTSPAAAAAIMREVSEMYEECGRWAKAGSDVVVRSHVHRYVQVQLPGARGLQIGATTPGWQGRTPFGYRLAGKMRTPQFGGLLVRVGDDGLFVRSKVWGIGD